MGMASNKGRPDPQPVLLLKGSWHVVSKAISRSRIYFIN